MNEARVDVLVIGAGPAGASAAWAAARAGAGRVLIAERSPWPRSKVCGSCVNPVALRVLERMGVAGEAVNGRARLSRVRVRSGRADACLRVDAGVAIERSDLDAALVSAAQRAGAEFRAGASVRVVARTDHGWTALVGASPVAASVVIACDGLCGTSLADVADQFALHPRVARSSWMGAGAVVEGDDAPWWHDLVGTGEVAMHAGDAGYVGLVRLDAGRVDIAAALHAAAVRVAGGPGPLIASVLESCGVRSARQRLAGLRVRGTGLLTRRRTRSAAPGLLIAGDAAAYVEPFTGEGIGWALTQGEHAGTLAGEAVASPHAWARLDAQWQSWLARAIEPRRRACRAVRWLAHRGAVRRCVVTVLAGCRPARGLAESLVRRFMHAPGAPGGAAPAKGVSACVP